MPSPWPWKLSSSSTFQNCHHIYLLRYGSDVCNFACLVVLDHRPVHHPTLQYSIQFHRSNHHRSLVARALSACLSSVLTRCRCSSLLLLLLLLLSIHLQPPTRPDQARPYHTIPDLSLSSLLCGKPRIVSHRVGFAVIHPSCKEHRPQKGPGVLSNKSKRCCRPVESRAETLFA